MTDIVRDPYGNPLKRDATITALRAENERLRAALLGANTALAAVDAFEHDFRYIIGNTNTEIWKIARVNVRAALEPSDE